MLFVNPKQLRPIRQSELWVKRVFARAAHQNAVTALRSYNVLGSDRAVKNDCDERVSLGTASTAEGQIDGLVAPGGFSKHAFPAKGAGAN